MVVVAPTGIAASNAGGATVHAQFNLPNSVFHPQQTGLLDGITYNKNRKKALLELELLVIDEVSMLRSDMLDAIDYLLKKVRQSAEIFGGVQVLLIGDPFQLPPVIDEKIWSPLSQIYKSPYFFDALVFKQQKPGVINLKKIYRQKDSQFIELLNDVREGILNNTQLSLLNDRCLQPGQDITGYLTLTTHNENAKRINQEMLDNFGGELHTFNAIIEGNFDPGQCLAEVVLEVKTGMPVMLIKNQKESPVKYYNGRIGNVVQVTNDRVTISFEDGDKLELAREIWLDTEYVFDEKSNGFQPITKGSMQQFPLKPAAAITIHKSQGLTFERAVIDLENVFIPGQTYVALSRLISLDGLLLKSALTSKTLKFDDALLSFENRFLNITADDSALHIAQQRYIYSLITGYVDWNDLLQQIFPAQFLGQPVLSECYELIKSLGQIAENFILIIKQAYDNRQLNGLYERIRASAVFFSKKIDDELLPKVQEFISKNRNSIHGKRYLGAATNMVNLLKEKRKTFEKLTHLSSSLHGGLSIFEAITHVSI